MAHEFLTRSDQLRQANPNIIINMIGDCGGMQAVFESFLPPTARPFSTHVEMTGGQSRLDVWAGGVPLKAQAVNADGSVTALTVVNSASPASGELGYQQAAATGKVSLYLNAADTLIRTVEMAANALSPNLVAYLALPGVG